MKRRPPHDAEPISPRGETPLRERLHVGVVAYEMEGRRSGVGRYLEGLLRGLQTENPPGWRWTLFFQGDPFASDLFSNDTTTDGGAPIRGVFDHRPGSRPIPWEQVRLPWILRRHDVDFLFSPAYSLPPFSGLPRMLTLHDLSFESQPEEFGWRERLRRRVLARLAAARATRVLTDTKNVAREIQVSYGVEPERIGVVPLAVEEDFFVDPASVTHQRPMPDGLEELGIRQPYLLHLGSILPRRLLPLTLEAFARLAAEDDEIQLVLAGADRLPDPTELDRRIESSGAAERIVRVPWVPEHLLVPLYRHAAASIYISNYEGYGLPPLESLAAGTPAVVTDGMALDDLWPDYPCRVERTPQSLLDGIRGALERPSTDFAEKAREVVGRLDWKASAGRLVDEIRIALEAARAAS